MPKKAIEIRIEEVPEGRFLVTTYDNGEVTREPVEKRPRKKRYPDRPYRKWVFEKRKTKDDEP